MCLTGGTVEPTRRGLPRTTATAAYTPCKKCSKFVFSYSMVMLIRQWVPGHAKGRWELLVDLTGGTVGPGRRGSPRGAKMAMTGQCP